MESQHNGSNFDDLLAEKGWLAQAESAPHENQPCGARAVARACQSVHSAPAAGAGSPCLGAAVANHTGLIQVN